MGGNSKVHSHPWLQSKLQDQSGICEILTQEQNNHKERVLFVSFWFTYLSTESKVKISKQLVQHGFCYKPTHQELVVLVAGSENGCSDYRWQTFLDPSLPSNQGLEGKFDPKIQVGELLLACLLEAGCCGV